MEQTVENYLKMEPLILPIKHEGGFSLNFYDIHCNKCDKLGIENRAEVIHRNNCMDINAAAMCPHCKIITFTRSRFYEDCFLLWTNDGIKKFVFVKSWWVRFLEFFGL
jgi:hypothetical protein